MLDVVSRLIISPYNRLSLQTPVVKVEAATRKYQCNSSEMAILWIFGAFGKGYNCPGSRDRNEMSSIAQSFHLDVSSIQLSTT